MPPTPPPAGWYQDPGGPGLRWWDGAAWTEHRQAAVPSPPPAPVGLPTPPPAPAPGGYVPSVPVQKWWHIPLLVALGVASTAGYILLQLLS